MKFICVGLLVLLFIAIGLWLSWRFLRWAWSEESDETDRSIK